MYVKQLLGVKEGESKMLGLLWNKIEDEIAVVFPEEPDDITKRGTLRWSVRPTRYSFAFYTRGEVSVSTSM